MASKGMSMKTIATSLTRSEEAGQTRFFQLINRDDVLAVCMRGLNTSQAVEVTFAP